MSRLAEPEFGERGIDACHKIVEAAEKMGAEDVAATYDEVIGRQVRFSNSKLDVIKAWLSSHVSMCVGKDDKITVASTDDIRPVELEKFVKGAMAALDRLPQRPIYAPLPDGPFEYAPIPDLYDPRLEGAEEELVDVAQEGIDAALQEGAGRAAGAIRSNAEFSTLITTGNVEATRRASSVYLEIRAFADAEATGHGATCSRRLDGIDPRRAGEEAGRDAVLAKRVLKADPGKYDVVFGRSALGNLVGIFGWMSSASCVLMQRTSYVDKLDEKIGSDRITLMDDPLAPGGFGSRAYDYEGLPSRRNIIIEEGVLKTYLHNRLTAKEFETESTANAGWIFPGPWNLVLAPGDLAEDEIIDELGDGLVVKNVTYLRFQNYRKGDFSAVIRDGVFRVRGGEIVGEARGLRLSDNILHLLSDAHGLTREAIEIWHWWMEYGVPVRTPLMAVKDVSFTAATI